MNIADIKLYALNGSSLMLSFTNIETIFKLILLGVSIGYTLHKWHLINKDKDND